MIAGETLNVIDPAEGVSTNAGASGNAASVHAEDEDVRVKSLQLTRNVSARTDVEVHGWSPHTAANTAAVGQGLNTDVSGGSLRAHAQQAVGQAQDGPPSLIEAQTRVTATKSSSGDTSALSVAVGNDQAHRVQGGDARVRSEQYHYGAGTRAATEVGLFHVTGEAQLSAVAGANQTVLEASSDTARLRADQRSTGSTEASVVGEVDNGQTVGAFSSAAANSVSLANQGANTRGKVTQDHQGYVRAESGLYVGAFGAVSAVANGVGNTVSAVGYGPALTLNTDQLNSGGVDATAAFEGVDGYDAEVHASAYGNAVSAQVCSDCDGALTAKNTQVNEGGVQAQTRVNVTGGARAVVSTSTAVGNQASYVVTRPNH